MKDNLQIATTYVYESIQGRYVTATHLDSFLETLSTAFKISTVGYSVKQQPIKAAIFCLNWFYQNVSILVLVNNVWIYNLVIA